MRAVNEWVRLGLAAERPGPCPGCRTLLLHGRHAEAHMTENISKRRKDAPADTALIEKARYLARQRLEAEPLTLSAGIKLERADRESLTKNYYEWAHQRDDHPRSGFSVWLQDAI